MENAVAINRGNTRVVHRINDDRRRTGGSRGGPEKSADEDRRDGTRAVVRSDR